MAQTCVPAPKGLSAWTTFDEALFQGPLRIPGHVGNAVRFDGVKQFFEMPTSLGFTVGEGDFSIELWVRTTSTNTIRNIVDFRSPVPKGWLVYLRRNDAGFQVADSAHISDVVAQGYSIADGNWHHIVGVAKRLPPQPLTIYVDGVKRAQAGKNVTLANLDHTTKLWLARHHRNGYVDRENVYFQGDLDELSVYRRALAANEVAALFKAGRAGKCRK